MNGAQIFCEFDTPIVSFGTVDGILLVVTKDGHSWVVDKDGVKTLIVDQRADDE